ncbi:hypothetical protein HYU90_03345 [Candidatus Collierbacteria bacterium]|nr:hypothetical protein [Candidatus Collierbacteria bacterium]
MEVPRIDLDLAVGGRTGTYFEGKTEFGKLVFERVGDRAILMADDKAGITSISWMGEESLAVTTEGGKFAAYYSLPDGKCTALCISLEHLIEVAAGIHPENAFLSDDEEIKRFGDGHHETYIFLTRLNDENPPMITGCLCGDLGKQGESRSTTFEDVMRSSGEIEGIDVSDLFQYFWRGKIEGLGCELRVVVLNYFVSLGWVAPDGHFVGYMANSSINPEVFVRARDEGITNLSQVRSLVREVIPSEE